MVDEVKEMEATTEHSADVGEISSSQVREHKLFKQLTKQLSEREARLAKIEADRAEMERQSKIQSEVEKGNYSAALAQIEAAKAAELQAERAEKQALLRDLELTRTSTKLLANGVVSEKASAFLASEYLAIPSDDRPTFDRWISEVKENQEFASFFAQAAPRPIAAADRAGASATRGGSPNAKQYQQWMENPRTCSPSQLSEAIGYHARHLAQHGKPPW